MRRRPCSALECCTPLGLPVEPDGLSCVVGVVALSRSVRPFVHGGCADHPTTQQNSLKLQANTLVPAVGVFLTRVLVAAALEQRGWVPATRVDVVTDGARGMRSLVASVAPNIAPKILDWFHLAMKLHAVKSPLFARPLNGRDAPVLIRQCGRLWRKVRDALWRGRGGKAIEIVRTLIASLNEEIADLSAFYANCAWTAHGAAEALLKFLVNNRRDLTDYQRARMAGRRVSSASAVMNHLINRRLSKRQRMRWSMKGAHFLLQTRVELLDGRLEDCFTAPFVHFRSLEMQSAL